MLACSRATRASAALCAALFACTPALAHGVAGDRFFPATLSTDDPAVADELSLPTLSQARTADEPSATQTDIAAEYSKRITARLGLSLAGDWTHQQGGGAPSVSGFQNLETTLKFQGLTDARHEAIVSGGVSVEWGRTGSERVGAEAVTTITPTLYFGKGAGDLPESLAWLRPAAVTGVVGYAMPSSPDAPRLLQTGVALEYSLPYLRARVRDWGLPEFVNRLTPLVEASFSTPMTNGQGLPTTGSLNPGVIWSGRRWQMGAEAMLPLNRDSGRAVGWVIQAHFYLDDLFPHSIGKPIW